MVIPMQVEPMSVARATNAAHYEFMANVHRWADEAGLGDAQWQMAAGELAEAFEAEDAAFKRYQASDRTAEIAAADEARDRKYLSLRDAIRAFAKFPLEEVAAAGQALQKAVDNYKVDVTQNYTAESGNIANLLQDLYERGEALDRLGLRELAESLEESNERVRGLMAERLDERLGRVSGEMKAARAASDAAWRAVATVANAYLVLNPDDEAAATLIKRLVDYQAYVRQYVFSSRAEAEQGDSAGSGTGTGGAETGGDLVIGDDDGGITSPSDPSGHPEISQGDPTDPPMGN